VKEGEAMHWNRTKPVLIFVLLFFLSSSCTAIIEPSGSTTVYVTKTGSSYHRSGCRYLSQSKIAITLEEAVEQGYAPCKVCKPPTL
jgi:hypothetical protein